jgi:predicted Zn-dependent peptidase
VIGRAEVISSVSRKALTAYHQAAYAADNIVVAAAGNVTHDRVVELLGTRLPATQSNARRARKPFGRVPPPGYRFQRKATEQYHVCLGAPGISRRDERRFAASLLDSILGGSASSRLFQEIREKRGMAIPSQLRLPSTPTRARSALRRHARGEPGRMLRDRRP